MNRQPNDLGIFRDHHARFLLKTIIAFEIVCLLSLFSGERAVSQPPQTVQVGNASQLPTRRTIECEGWTLHVSEDLYANDADLLDQALQLLEKQLQEIVRVVPESAVKKLQQVPLWISAEYPGTRPGAEYHPDAGWLKKNNRDPAMEKGVEFSNVRIFAEEARRMPNFALHELAHAYHDRFLPDGFSNAQVREAYDRAKASRKYESVEQRFGDGRSASVRAYAMTTPQEYFAECSEAFFSTNDFFPFTLEQLRKHDPEVTVLLAELWGVAVPQETSASDLQQRWKHSGSLWINTTENGVSLKPQSEIEDFPLCIRLYADRFPFSECKPLGEDLRIYSPANDRILAYEIDTWAPNEGIAALWVRVPRIRSDERQELRLYWGNPDAKAESSGSQVFNAANGFVTVWHFGGELADSTGLLAARDTGTQPTQGVVGQARRFSSGHGIRIGTDIDHFPSAAHPHATEAWILVDRPNTTILGWGIEKAQGKIVMQYRSPSRINMDCYFSGANIATDRIVPLQAWKHIVHSYSPAATRIYVDGKLAKETIGQKPLLSLKNLSRFYIGGWYDRYDFEGVIDEVRISNVERSEDWVRLQYETQQPHSPLVGTIVTPGDDFSVTPGSLELREGESGRVTALAMGAEKLSWEIRRNGTQETILTDQLACSINAGRVAHDESFELVLMALYPDSVRSIAIPVSVENNIPEPQLSGILCPIAWDGRKEIILQPKIENMQNLSERGHANITCDWKTSDVAIASRMEGDRLILTRAQGDGVLRVDLKVHNGGPAKEATAYIKIQQPPRSQENWIERPVAANERPRDGQFIPRDGWGDSRDRKGKVVYAGNINEESQLAWKPEKLIARASTGSEIIYEQVGLPKSDGSYAFSLELPADLRQYRCQLIATRGEQEEILHQAADLVCGDVYLITGQSNAVATDFGKGADPATSPWVRTFGTTSSDPSGVQRELWGQACARSENGDLAIGYWGLELGKSLSEQERMPICVLNGAVGGTRIDQHQRNSSNPTDAQTIYGRLLGRARRARITHGVRGIFWHQGENDQGADGPTNRFGYETYETHFVDLAAAWKEDYPNTEHYFAFQIWPKACAMGFDGSDNRLREVQRRLPRLFSNMSIVSTLGIHPPGGCHYPADGYSQFARIMLPVVEQKIYGSPIEGSTTSPNLQNARWGDAKRQTLELIFDSPMNWNERCVDQFFIGDEQLEIDAGGAEGDRVTLRLKFPWTAKDEKPSLLTYVDSQSWSQDRLLEGVNHLAALSFCDVPIQDH